MFYKEWVNLTSGVILECQEIFPDRCSNTEGVKECFSLCVMFGKWTICLKWPMSCCTAWQLYRSIGGHLTFLTVDRIWQVERANNEIKSSGRVSVGVFVAVSWVLYRTFLFLCVRVPRAAVIGVSSTPDWFEKLDEMSPVWKQPIYKPSSRNFREKPVPSKSEWELLATSGSEVKKNPWQAKRHLTQGWPLAL